MRTGMISKDTMRFLKDLGKNNNRDWFIANKLRYDSARAEFQIFVEHLFKQIVKFDPGVAHHRAQDCIFRIYRDVRFAKDKSPYKTHFGAYVSPALKKSEIHTRAGYYIHLQPGESFVAGGAYTPESAWIKAIRQEIDYNAPEFLKIVKSKKFIECFGQLEGETLKTTPKDYAADHPMIDYLKMKSFLATHSFSDNQVLSEDFLTDSVKVFKTMAPLNAFLNRSTE